MKDVKQGDMVWVTWAWRTVPERLPVVKVGRTLAHVDNRGRIEKFRLEDGQTADRSGSGHFVTEAEHAEAERESAATATLRAAGLGVTVGRSASLALLEALAEVAKTFIERESR